MRRREFVSLLGGAAAWPLAARAQQATMPVIGFLGAVSPNGFSDRLQAFHQGLKDTGYAEGANVEIEYRWAENRLDRLPGMAADLVNRKVAVIVSSGGTAPTIAAKVATATIPVVFAIPEDPVKLGLVTSLARPGGNLTGVNFFFGELVAKRLQILRELVPAMTRVAMFVNPANPTRAELHARDAETAGRRMGLRIQVYNVGSSRDIDVAFADLLRERPDALFVSPDPFFTVRRVQLATLAARHAIPTSFSTREPVDAGGLVSYGPNLNAAYRQTGVYTGRVLKGAKPADLPVMQSSKFELIINERTAQMLGLTVPPTLLAIADEVIE
jgi:putative ABC transport system substrate-binding protein